MTKSSSSLSSSSVNGPWSIYKLFFSISLICTLFMSSYLLFNKPVSAPTSILQNTLQDPGFTLKVFVSELPRSYNYGLLQEYWSLPPDNRIRFDPDHVPGLKQNNSNLEFPPYPKNPVTTQNSAEYWLLGDLMTPEHLRNGSIAKRVYDVKEADVVFVPFFSALSCEMQLSIDRRILPMKVMKNLDYKRQKEVIDIVTNSEAWKRSGGRDHIFALSNPMAMWHVKDEIAPAILLVVDFGGWVQIDAKASHGNSNEKIGHTQVSLIKDVIVPYNHLLPALQLSDNQPRHNLLFYKGAKHRQRGGVIRAKLWSMLEHEPGVVMEEGVADETGRQQSIKGMRDSEFCLHPAGDTPTSCRLFDAIQSLCIPVIVSDQIELPFEGIIDYSEFSVFVSSNDALQPKWLVTHLQNISKEQREEYRKNLARVQPMFEYDNGFPGGIGPIDPNGTVNQIWKKIYHKVPMIKEAVTRNRRKPPGTSIPLRCQCT
ncbi:putative arabinosyltransferase ARAD1 isoform X1 [Silene latifolia]|uniref:putative arabinosyltransferase ARAD1 isoform X1 n=1 Tax=Silene latifolia TaxID=37657 RepID=UPI003D78596A